LTLVLPPSPPRPPRCFLILPRCFLIQRQPDPSRHRHTPSTVRVPLADAQDDVPHDHGGRDARLVSTPPSRPRPLTPRSHACSFGPALHRCQAFAPPASGITRAMAVRNAGAPRPPADDPVTPAFQALHARPNDTLARRPTRPSARLSPAPHMPTPHHPYSRGSVVRRDGREEEAQEEARQEAGA
jgi:hypothetical protein